MLLILCCSKRLLSFSTGQVLADELPHEGICGDCSETTKCLTPEPEPRENSDSVPEEEKQHQSILSSLLTTIQQKPEKDAEVGTY